MKIKPLYIYLFGIVLAIAVFLFISKDSGSSVAPSQSEIANSQMPNDDIHKGMGNQNGTMPGKDNVSDVVKNHLEMLKKAVDESPNDTTKLKEYADFLSAAHKQHDAIPYYEKILKVNPKRTDVILSLAYINYTDKKFDQAEKLLNSILAYDKNDLQVYYNLGAIAFSSGNKDKAKQIWTKLSKEHPNTPMGDLAKKSLEQF